jgi:hypothetical protein
MVITVCAVVLALMILSGAERLKKRFPPHRQAEYEWYTAFCREEDDCRIPARQEALSRWQPEPAAICRL